jgi:hypothetical protein
MVRCKQTRTWLVVATLILLFWTTGSARAGPPAAAPPADRRALQGEVGPAVVVTPLLQYQGRLTDPGSGDPVADGVYEIRFRLYNAEDSGTPLWTETEDVPVAGGLFSTVLGDASALDPALFNGQALWLGIKVGSDGEARPRQPVLPVAYALSLVPGAIVEASSGPGLTVSTTGGGEALRVGGDLVVDGGLIGGGHSHSGEQITGGTVADARIAASLARDAEVEGMIDGHRGDPSAHHPRFTPDEAWDAVLGRDGPGSGLNADLLDGLSAGSFASASHNHDTRYYTEGESDVRYVNATGDAMSGPLTVPQIKYNPARTHYFVVGSEGFVPGSNVDYWNTYGNGGAYVGATGCHALVAPVHLPHGATVTSFKIFFNDSSAGNLRVWLYKQFLTGGGYSSLAYLETSGTPGYSSLTNSSISSPTVSNTSTSYHVYVYSCDWDSNLRIKGALVTYTISEAP